MGEGLNPLTLQDCHDEAAEARELRDSTGEAWPLLPEYFLLSSTYLASSSSQQGPSVNVD